MVISLALVLMILCILETMQAYALREEKGRLLEESNILASFATDYVTGRADVAAFSPSLYMEDRSARTVLLDKDSRVLHDTGISGVQRGKIMSAPWILRAFSGENVTHRTEENGLHYLLSAVPVYDGSVVAGVLIVKTDAEPLYAFFSHMQYRLVVIGIAGSLTPSG